MHPETIRAAVFDIDGTLAMMDKDAGTYEALPGAVEALTDCRARGLPVVAYRSPEFDRLEAPVIGYDTVDGFVAGMERALADAAHDAVRKNQRIWAAGHSWARRARELEDGIRHIRQ